jgi:hypothetical protein
MYKINILMEKKIKSSLIYDNSNKILLLEIIYIFKYPVKTFKTKEYEINLKSWT